MGETAKPSSHVLYEVDVVDVIEGGVLFCFGGSAKLRSI